jgi:hypothetical protein
MREESWSRSQFITRGAVTALAIAMVTACDVQTEDTRPRAGDKAVLADRCEVHPPFTPNFEPELEWAWTGSSVMPDHKQVMMTPAVVDDDGTGIGREQECREDNNTASATVRLACSGCIKVRLSDYNLFLLEDYSGGHDVQGRARPRRGATSP